MADIASTLLEWSTTASSNAPSGSTSVGSGLDDNLREIQAVIRQYLSNYNGSAIASSGTCAIGGHAGLFIEISGTTSITSFGTPTTGSNWKIVRFQDTLTIGHNSTSLILPGAENIITGTGDYMLAFHRGSGNWTVPFYSRASGRIVTTDAFGTTINVATEDTAPVASTDYVPTYDADASTAKKVLISNILKAVNGLTEDASPVISTDYLLTYDASAGAAKKALLSAFAATASVAGVAELATAAEALTGTDAARVLTPASLGGNFGGNSGAWSINLPGGLHVRGGGGAYADNGGSGTSYAFDSSFPTAFWGVTCGYSSANTGHTGPRVTSTAVSGITVVINPGSGGNGTLWYLAWGN